MLEPLKIKRAYFPAFEGLICSTGPVDRLREFAKGSRKLPRLFVWLETPEGFTFWKRLLEREWSGKDIRKEVLRRICEDQEDCTWA